MMKPTRSMIAPRSRNFDWYLDALEQRGIQFDRLTVVSTAGDIRPPSPYQWEAQAVLRAGEDDSLTGIGPTPIAALRALYRVATKEGDGVT